MPQYSNLFMTLSKSCVSSWKNLFNNYKNVESIMPYAMAWIWKKFYLSTYSFLSFYPYKFMSLGSTFECGSGMWDVTFERAF